MTDKEFLLAIMDYIEACETTIENEWGSLRSLDELIADDEMPPLYAEVCRRINE